MKTAEKILVTSLDLFNHHGENNVSSVDIALELDISPGNLYYHFKGKEIIVSALFELYKAEMDKVLRAGTNRELEIEDFFYFLYLVFEKGQLFQFFFHNPADLFDKYSGIAKPFKIQLITQEKCIEKMLFDFQRKNVFSATDGQIMQIVELIGLVFTQSANYYSMKGQAVDDEEYLYKSLASILFAVLPYIKIEPGELHQLQEAIASHSLIGEFGEKEA